MNFSNTYNNCRKIYPSVFFAGLFLALCSFLIPSRVDAAHFLESSNSFYANPNPTAADSTLYWSANNGAEYCELFFRADDGSWEPWGQELGSVWWSRFPEWRVKRWPISGSVDTSATIGHNIDQPYTTYDLSPPRSYRVKCIDPHWYGDHDSQREISVSIAPPPVQPSFVNVNVSGVPSGATANWTIDANYLGQRTRSGGNGSYTESYQFAASYQNVWTRLYPGAVYQNGTTLSCSWSVTPYEAAFLYPGQTLTFNLSYNCAPQKVNFDVSIDPGPAGWVTVQGQNLQGVFGPISGNTCQATNTSYSYCRFSVDANTQLSATASQNSGWAFSRWDAHCSGSGAYCSLYMDGNKLAGAKYIQPPTANIEASSNNINQGQNATLAWSSTNADSCTASEGWNGNKPTSGNQSVNPNSPTRYRITCTGAGGSATDYVDINVNALTNNASIVSYNVSSNWNACETKQVSVTMQNTGSKTWVVTGSGAAGDYNLGTYDNQWGNARQSVNGSVSPGQQKTFTWNATAPCSGGSYSFRWRMVEEMVQWFGQELNLTLTVNNPQPTAALSVSPTQTNQGSSSTLYWSSSNATICNATGGWSGTKSTSGSESVSPNSTTTYYLTCSGSGGTSPQVSATVTVIPNRNLTVSTTGSGYVTASGISCPGDCSQTYTDGTLVTLLATPNSAQEFSSWSGACAGQGISCSIQMTSDKTATANFVTSFNYSLSNSGNVSVQKGGIDQYGQTTITKTLTAGTTQGVTLSASGMPSGVSASFSSQGCAPNCSSTATFTVTPQAPAGTYPITVTGSPLGKTTQFSLTIIDSPAVIVYCSVNQGTAALGESVTFSATPEGGTETGFTYVWSGPGVPSNPAPTSNPYTVAFSTIGRKQINVTVYDSIYNQGNCSSGENGIPEVNITFDPEFEEF